VCQTAFGPFSEDWKRSFLRALHLHFKENIIRQQETFFHSRRRTAVSLSRLKKATGKRQVSFYIYTTYLCVRTYYLVYYIYMSEREWTYDYCVRADCKLPSIHVLCQDLKPASSSYKLLVSALSHPRFLFRHHAHSRLKTSPLHTRIEILARHTKQRKCSGVNLSHMSN
jgi:hypothetical protein